MSDKSIDIQALIVKLASDPTTAAIVSALEPFLGVIKREGFEFANRLIGHLLIGDFDAVDEMAWVKMTEAERDAYSRDVLKEAMDEVDRQFELQKMAKEAAFKVATSLLSLLL